MGCLMTLTIRLDNLKEIEASAQRFVEGICSAATRNTAGVIFGNTIVQAPRHVDSFATYVQIENTCHTMTARDPDTLRFMRNSPKCFENTLNYLEKQIAELRASYGPNKHENHKTE